VKRDFIEILIGLAVLEAALWTERRLQRELSVIAAVIIFGLAAADRRSWRELGVTRFGGLGAVKLILAAIALGAAILAVGGWGGTLHGMFGQRDPVIHAMMYSAWAITQQFILQSFFFLRLESLLRSGRWAVVAAALLFSFVHLPNPILMAATLAGGLLLCELFARGRSIWPLGLAHATVGLAIAVSVPAYWLRNMRVGLGYLNYR
jgi:membrane protease YdiL (CAAX protease family)